MSRIYVVDMSKDCSQIIIKLSDKTRMTDSNNNIVEEHDCLSTSLQVVGAVVQELCSKLELKKNMSTGVGSTPTSKVTKQVTFDNGLTIDTNKDELIVKSTPVEKKESSWMDSQPWKNMIPQFTLMGVPIEPQITRDMAIIGAYDDLTRPLSRIELKNKQDEKQPKADIIKRGDSSIIRTKDKFYSAAQKIKDNVLKTNGTKVFDSVRYDVINCNKLVYVTEYAHTVKFLCDNIKMASLPEAQRNEISILNEEFQARPELWIHHNGWDYEVEDADSIFRIDEQITTANSTHSFTWLLVVYPAHLFDHQHICPNFSHPMLDDRMIKMIKTDYFNQFRHLEVICQCAQTSTLTAPFGIGTGRSKQIARRNAASNLIHTLMAYLGGNF